MKFHKPFILIVMLLITVSSCDSNVKLAGRLSNGAGLILQKNSDGLWGLSVEQAGLSSMHQSNPLQVELYVDSNNITQHAIGYNRVRTKSNGFTGTAELKIDDVIYSVTDIWQLSGNELTVSRNLAVTGNGTGGFLSAITFSLNQPKEKARYFAPGMMYGNADYITRVAIGGHEGGDATWVREDRLPAPMFGMYAEDGSSVTILNPTPLGHTTRADSRDRQVITMIDNRFQFGSIGAEKSHNSLVVGYKYPGIEGETTYRGFFYPGGQVNEWRRRYHPVEDGFEQNYSTAFRFDTDPDFATYYNRAWRWAWNILQPQLNPQYIEQARRSLIDMLAERVETHRGITGLSNSMDFEEAITGNINYHPLRKTVMGFTGKSLEAANFLLQDADMEETELAAEHRQKALAIINSYLKLELAPPAGEGFFWETGLPAPALPRLNRVFLRSFGDDLKSLLRAAQRAKKLTDVYEGYEDYTKWVDWVRTFADWLLPQQSIDGGFPRAWEPGTGKVVDPSPNSSYNAIPFLLLLSDLTGDRKYKEAAVRAGEFCWKNGQSEGIFVGGTIDNPDVVDKEAGTLSLEAYIALYEATGNEVWLDRAKTAAAFSESWIYIWDIPMPEDETEDELHWKRGVSTIGIQLISTGHSLADAYMAFDADDFAKMYAYTGDSHYKKVAAILLHNTKGMLGLPGRTYDLPGTGWQQEHWSLAPERGIGRKRMWLPWVSTSHLNGIFGLMEFDKELYDEISQKTVLEYK
jgi:hypothetical protein